MLWQFYPWFNSYYPLFMCIVQCNVDNEPRIKLNRNIEGPAQFPQFVNAGLCSVPQATNFCLWATRKTHFCIMLKGWEPQNSQLGPLSTTSQSTALE